MSKNREVGENDLIIKFPTKEAAEHFASWLCGSGEQHYWDWMEYREDELEDDDDAEITVRRFHYHGEEDETKAVTDSSRYGEFMCDNTIRTTMGRLKRNG